MELINEGDIFRLKRDNQTVPMSHHILIAISNQTDNTVHGLFLTTGPRGYEDCIVSGPYPYPLYFDRDGCEKL